ncbi:MAG: class I SAM-dependent methyltransferase [Planctomycetota bacterium]|jgi:ubiquinone/menaquinone biosynthesis C-methylase UbiE
MQEKPDNEMNAQQEAFERTWRNRTEAHYTHWTRRDPVNQVQLAFRNHWHLFQEIMSDKIQGNRVLEIGCGRGSMSAYFADNGFDCTLLDRSVSAIETAKELFASNSLRGRCHVGDAMVLPYADESFDVVFSIGLLEHIEDIHTAIGEQIRVLLCGGLFLGYVVPEYTDNVQKKYDWVNEVLKGIVKEMNDVVKKKGEVFRSNRSSEAYIEVLEALPVVDILATGVYPLPMISYSTEFPFTLLSPESEWALVNHFQAVLDQRKLDKGVNPWLCEEGYGQAFLVSCFKV